MRRLDWVLRLTSFAAGSVDVVSFAWLGKVLASAMTGNLALLGLYLGRGATAPASRSAAALAAFAVGAGLATWAVRVRHRALKLLLTAELATLLAAAIFWAAAGRPSGGISGIGVIVPLALGMGMQIIAARQLNLAGVPTVVFTSTFANLVNGAIGAFMGGAERMPPDVWRQSAALLSYFCGALTAGICVHCRTDLAMFLPAAAVGTALALLAD